MKYAFADCRLDTASRELARNGAEVHLSPKAYELLRLLIDHRPRVMSKQELMNELWPDTFVVEANLHVLIGELRAALGDKSARTSTIKTHHGVGYSFAAEVRELKTRPRRSERRRVFVEVEGRRIPLGDGTSEVGRDEDCDVCLDDTSVSRHHARIEVSGSVVTVEDRASKNGTSVNGKRVSKTKTVASGDTITFGTVKTTIVIVRPVSPSTVTL